MERASEEPFYQDDEISLLALASVLLRWRKVIAMLAITGGILGVAKGLTATRVYQSTAIFLPQESSESGLAAAAGQFGIRVPATGAWGPLLYVQMLRSRVLLEPLANDTLVLPEMDGRRVSVLELLRVGEAEPARRLDNAVRALQRLIGVEEIKSLNAVRLNVTTQWPSVSQALAERLMQGINRFNFQTRQSQAAAERQFVEKQAAEAEQTLRVVEEKLQNFLERNRIVNSPELTLEIDRLQRDITLRQQLYTGMMQSTEEARIREVRDTPVITVLETPRVPVMGQPRNSLGKGILGAMFGALLGAVIAFAARAFARARGSSSEEAQEFFRLLHEAKPRFRRGAG